MSSRQSDVGRFYRAMEHLRRTLGGYRHLVDCHARMGWPNRGVYFFFEAGEYRAPPHGDQLRVVRVGTHAVSRGSRTILWRRLRQHRGRGKPGEVLGGNHRGSVFRRHVGAALLQAGKSPVKVARTWGRRGVSPDDRRREAPLEIAVSQRIARMPFLWIVADDAPGKGSVRSFIERNSIALLAGSDVPSRRWLGKHATAPEIRRSGLWNVDYVGEEYDLEFLDVLETRVRKVRVFDGP